MSQLNTAAATTHYVVIKMFKKALTAVAIAALTQFTPAQAAVYTAVGVQNDVSYDAVINGGWEVLYRGHYGDSFSFSDVVAGVADNTNIMVAGIQNNSSNFDVLAYASKADVTQVTAINGTHEANGTNWYYNNYSMGFAGQGDVIFQTSADVVGSGQFGYDTIERDRLSWHTGSVGYVFGGWRSGSNIWLNGSTDFDRVVLVQKAAAAVPEPETYALLLAGIATVAMIRRQRNRA